jgi:hypothetical protein
MNHDLDSGEYSKGDASNLFTLFDVNGISDIITRTSETRTITKQTEAHQIEAKIKEFTSSTSDWTPGKITELNKLVEQKTAIQSRSNPTTNNYNTNMTTSRFSFETTGRNRPEGLTPPTQPKKMSLSNAKSFITELTIFQTKIETIIAKEEKALHASREKVSETTCDSCLNALIDLSDKNENITALHWLLFENYTNILEMKTAILEHNARFAVQERHDLQQIITKTSDDMTKRIGKLSDDLADEHPGQQPKIMELLIKIEARLSALETKSIGSALDDTITITDTNTNKPTSTSTNKNKNSDTEDNNNIITTFDEDVIQVGSHGHIEDEMPNGETSAPANKQHV